ncbi:YveK family protein [Parasporobacterium paucivorans]|uniref:Capsular polysaccharide biosynthesis protein n=1 Tax=Parasporobacterium paucivorans DSM 15970 TaxID=1122934 RepID=A0A1M6E8D1_9FIRM|nr:Wzz/FepE/Etk N-terminal domain-containing protein [Parasporobacterium paucivorans]SHI81757.1 Capsular polysaccharide biosynthesis protein [Parasporobacterium paucivorans DSM 15970]
MEPAIKKDDEIEIDLRELFGLLYRKIWIIIIAGVACVLIAFLISNFALTPTYESTTKIYILNKQESGTAITYNDLQTGSQLTQDYMELIVSRPVMEQVIAELDLDMSVEELAAIISVTNPTNTRIMNITVEYTDPYKTKEIADYVRNAASGQIMKVMSIDQVNLVEEAFVPTASASPNTRRNMAIGGIAGILLACAVIFLRYFLDDTIKSSDDIEKYLGLSVLGIIPIQTNMEENEKKKKTRKKKSKINSRK